MAITGSLKEASLPDVIRSFASGGGLAAWP